MKFLIFIFLLNTSYAFSGIKEIKSCKKHKEEKAFYKCVAPFLGKNLSEFRKKRKAAWLYMNPINKENLRKVNLKI